MFPFFFAIARARYRLQYSLFAYIKSVSLKYFSDVYVKTAFTEKFFHRD